jgi:hypothetical protein
MNILPRSLDSSQATHSSAFQAVLSPEALRHDVPAVFAPSAHERLSAAYTFVPTARILDALRQARFLPVEARQTRTRVTSPVHARHMIRLRRTLERVALADAVPELVLLNSHDGTSAYLLRCGIYRAVCTNGLVVSVGVFPALRVLHRGDVVDELVRGALEMSERFGVLATIVERMQGTLLEEPQRLEFAGQALTLRYPDCPPGTMTPAQLLAARRPEDLGSDLWRTFNVVQENLIRGGLIRRSATGRVTRTRRITSIREEVRLNTALWDLAMARAA